MVIAIGMLTLSVFAGWRALIMWTAALILTEAGENPFRTGWFAICWSVVTIAAAFIGGLAL